MVRQPSISQKLKIIHRNSKLGGGAGLAALRLHRALREASADSHLLSGSGSSAVDGWQRFAPTESTAARYLDRFFDPVRIQAVFLILLQRLTSNPKQHASPTSLINTPANN